MSSGEQLYLGNYEPTDSDIMDQAFAVPLEVKIKKAILLLKEYETRALRLSDGGYHACDSFGKDSSCIVKLCEMAGVKHECHHNLTTIDPPELMRFGKKHRPDTVINRSKYGHLILEKMVAKANPPTRLGRWCCEFYKEHGGDGKVKVIGVRCAESARRAGLWKTVNPNVRGGLIVAPIAYWTDKDVWDFHKMMDLPYCELYDQGFTRLGCVGCPLAGKEGQDREFKRWPGYERLWKKGFQMLWDKWHGVPTQRVRITEFIEIKGNFYAANKQKKSDWDESIWETFEATELETPLSLDGKWYGRSRQRYFEKYLSAEGFYHWWRSGGAVRGR